MVLLPPLRACVQKSLRAERSNLESLDCRVVRLRRAPRNDNTETLLTQALTLSWNLDTPSPQLLNAGGHPLYRHNLRCTHGPVVISPAICQGILSPHPGEAGLHRKLRRHQKVRRRSVGRFGSALVPVSLSDHGACCIHLAASSLLRVLLGSLYVMEA